MRTLRSTRAKDEATKKRNRMHTLEMMGDMMLFSRTQTDDKDISFSMGHGLDGSDMSTHVDRSDILTHA